jgi:hypothetical protein
MARPPDDDDDDAIDFDRVVIDGDYRRAVMRRLRRERNRSLAPPSLPSRRAAPDDL